MAEPRLSWLEEFFAGGVKAEEDGVAVSDTRYRTIDFADGVEAEDADGKLVVRASGGAVDHGPAWVRMAWYGTGLSALEMIGTGNVIPKTTGARFRMLQAGAVIHGARFLFGHRNSGGAASLNCKVTIWRDSDNAVLVTKTVLLQAADRGLHYIAFDAPLVIDAPLVNVDLTIGISMLDPSNGAANYTRIAETDYLQSSVSSSPFQFPGGVKLMKFGLFTFGDVRPTSEEAAGGGWVEPAFTVA